jgi:mRNA-degrading endonuclease RelE of RelBE toxin-antitoxin system
MRILECVDRYLTSRTGEVKKLKPPFTDLRIRCGDYRVFFDFKGGRIEIMAVRHRKDAYR